MRVWKHLDEIFLKQPLSLGVPPCALEKIASEVRSKGCVVFFTAMTTVIYQVYGTRCKMPGTAVPTRCKMPGTAVPGVAGTLLLRFCHVKQPKIERKSIQKVQRSTAAGHL